MSEDRREPSAVAPVSALAGETVDAVDGALSPEASTPPLRLPADASGAAALDNDAASLAPAEALEEPEVTVELFSFAGDGLPKEDLLLDHDAKLQGSFPEIQVSLETSDPSLTAASSAGTTPAEPNAGASTPTAEVADAAVPAKSKRSWFRHFFSDDYLRTVRPPSQAQLLRQVDFIEASLGLQRGASILDVGCGLGLQAIELSKRGYLVVGVDLSLPMLSRAAEEAQHQAVQINFLHADMRELNFDGAFDAILCLGTTLGYFSDVSNVAVIENLYRALKPMGLLLLDVVNRDYVHRTVPDLTWFEGEGCVCMEETGFNYLTSRLQVMRNVILDGGRQYDTRYSLRVYSVHELGQLLHQTGFRVAQVSGHESTPGVFFGSDSPRMLLLAERRVETSTEAETKDDRL